MPLPDLPAQGALSWYTYYQALAAAVDTNEIAIDSVSGAPSLGIFVKEGSNFIGKCSVHGVISTNTNAATVLQALIDHCSNYVGGTGHKGGRIDLLERDIPITTPIQTRPVTTGSADDSSTVWPLCIRGQGSLPRPGATTGALAGTVLRWNSGSAPSGTYQAVLNASNNCHGYKFEDFTIDANNVAACCAVSAGWKATWTRIQFRSPKVAGFPGGGLTPTWSTAVGCGLLFTNGTDTTPGVYAQQRSINCDHIGNDGGIGVIVKNTQPGSACTDGVIEDFQCNGLNHGGGYLGQDGWVVRGGHLTMNSSAGASRNWNLWIDGENVLVTNLYVDVTGLGPSIYATKDNYSVTNCFIIANNKSPSNAHPGFGLGDTRGIVYGNIWGGTNNSFDYFVERSGTGSIILCNSGPVGSIGTNIISNALTNTDYNISF
jgi:hypothetical protein